MKIAISNQTNPYHNLSLEEIILKDPEIKEDILLLYINKNVIIFGRNQNIYEEINAKYVEKNNIKLVRRISGGGAVYQDEGNINFSFITNNKKASYSYFLKPIIAFLKTLKLDAQFKGKNDITVNNFKVSGNAQYKYKDRMFHHGTLLFNANLQVLGDALKPNKLKLQSKSIKSARQRVSNIKDLLSIDLSAKDFVKKLIDFFVEKKQATLVNYNNYKKNEVAQLIKMRTSNKWIFGKNPDFNVSNEKKFDGGVIKFVAKVEKNKIIDFKFIGDFLSSNDFEKINNLFINEEFTMVNIYQIINNVVNFEDYFGKLTKKEVVSLFN